MSVDRALERRRAAAVRAVGRDPRAEFRHGTLFSGLDHHAVASPYLTLAEVEDETISRGLADAVSMLLRHTDYRLHRDLRPESSLQRVVFDMLEQLRCLALAPALPGVKVNLDAVSDAWDSNARASGVAESGVGLLIYTLTHMVRARLGLGATTEQIDAIIEAPRAALAQLIGHALPDLAMHVGDQAEYAQAALEISRLVAEMASDARLDDDEASAAAARYRMLVPPDWMDVDGEPGASVETMYGALVETWGNRQSLEQLGDYEAWTTDYDVVQTGRELYPKAIRRRARLELDELVRAQAVSPHRIAERLRRLFGTWKADELEFGVSEGIVDGRRLAQIISTPDEQDVFQNNRFVIRSNTALAILMDNSGSMRNQRHEILATLVDTLSHALDLAGVTHEILGHTTAAWTGGRPMKDWRKAGQPEAPGRLAELAHIVYKDADTSYRRARESLATMKLTSHYRESIEGEAVVWAYNRLIRRPEARKVLVVVSDGAPSDAATNMANRDGFLPDHLARVVDFIERRTPVELGALTVDHDVSTIFRRSLPIDLDATLTIGSYSLLEALFNR